MSEKIRDLLWWIGIVSGILILLVIFGLALDQALKRFEPVATQVIVYRVPEQVWPEVGGLYAIWRDSAGVPQWNRMSDTLVWKADTMIHPLFVPGSVYWDRRYPDTLDGFVTGRR